MDLSVSTLEQGGEGVDAHMSLFSCEQEDPTVEFATIKEQSWHEKISSPATFADALRHESQMWCRQEGRTKDAPDDDEHMEHEELSRLSTIICEWGISFKLTFLTFERSPPGREACKRTSACSKWPLSAEGRFLTFVMGEIDCRFQANSLVKIAARDEKTTCIAPGSSSVGVRNSGTGRRSGEKQRW